MRSGLLTIAVLTLCLFAAPVRGDEVKPEVYVNALVDLGNAFGEDGLPLANTFRRGDSHFDAMRATLFADVVFSERLALFNQIIIAPASRASLASFLRIYFRYTAIVRDQGDLHFEAGKLPTSFGSFSPRAYSHRNALISIPLMHYYYTTIRSNQLPADNADLIAHRGEGTGSEFTGFSGGGIGANFNGLPTVYDPCWDTGVRAIGSIWRLEFVAAVTQGTLSDPKQNGGDNNEGKQVAGRVGLVLMPGLVVGGSFAHGPYLDSAVAPYLPAGAAVEDYDQQVWGVDLEMGYRHLQVFAEAAFNRWESPTIEDPSGNPEDLKNVAAYIEAKYTVAPGLYLAGRFDEIRFGDIDDGTGNPTPWDNPVRRTEVGLGYTFRDGVTGKIVRQDFWEKDLDAGGSYEREGFFGAQLGFYF